MLYKFWIKSNRGTNDMEIVSFPDDYKADDIKAELEHWCQNFGAFTNSESMCRYGWEPIKKLPTRKQACDEQSRLYGKIDALQEKRKFQLAVINFIDREDERKRYERFKKQEEANAKS